MTYLLKVSKYFRPAAPTKLLNNARNNSSNTYPPLSYSEEVLQAKAEGKPVVALESTIITHGMPYPQNLETAIDVENIIRKQGVVPATTAIIQGELTVGLSKKQLEYLAQAPGVVKASRRDLAPVIAAKLDGATTVAGTLVATALADIPIFVTGGIGGVHRGGELTMDVSADLNELGRSQTLVVCSGVKSILDIGRTLEYLETQGVCVCSFGSSADFPAFYTPRSGHRAPHLVSDAAAAAKLLSASRALHITSGIVIGVPIPEEYAVDETTIENAIEVALKEAAEKRIQGKEVTPYILAAVTKATSGTSLAANIALIKNNARVGADIAVEYNKIKDTMKGDEYIKTKNMNAIENKSNQILTRKFHTLTSVQYKEKVYDSIKENKIGDVLVIGGANVDRTYRVTEKQIQRFQNLHNNIYNLQA